MKERKNSVVENKNIEDIEVDLEKVGNDIVGGMDASSMSKDTYIRLLWLVREKYRAGIIPREMIIQLKNTNKITQQQCAQILGE